MEAIGRLSGGIAHDFNNLLTAIRGYSELLLKELDGSPLRADVEEIFNAADRAATLTGQLLAFSRRQILSPEIVVLNQRVTDMSRMLDRLIGEHIAIDLHLASDLWPVRADAAQLEQVLVNLALNARDAMPRGRPPGDRDRQPRRHGEGGAGRSKSRPGRSSSCACATPASAFRSTCRAASSSRSSRPSRRAPAPGSACRWSMDSCARAAARSPSTARPARAARSRCCCRAPTTRADPRRRRRPCCRTPSAAAAPS